MDHSGAQERSSHLESTDFEQACQVSSMGQGTVISKNDNGKTGYPQAKG